MSKMLRCAIFRPVSALNGSLIARISRILRPQFPFTFFLLVCFEKRKDGYTANDEDQQHHRGDEVNFCVCCTGHSSSVESSGARFKLGLQEAIREPCYRPSMLINSAPGPGMPHRQRLRQAVSCRSQEPYALSYLRLSQGEAFRPPRSASHQMGGRSRK